MTGFAEEQLFVVILVVIFVGKPRRTSCGRSLRPASFARFTKKIDVRPWF